MYITTFYSYKGGVGRTLALANTAVLLAKQGRKVLMVDMDLEAPGLDTFNLPRSVTRKQGMVEYVSQYLNTGRAPDVRPFIYESAGIGKGEGRLFIMPAGAVDAGYGARFGSINWQFLYEQRHGY